jgi:hypothetical protein
MPGAPGSINPDVGAIQAAVHDAAGWVASSSASTHWSTD